MRLPTNLCGTKVARACLGLALTAAAQDATGQVTLSTPKTERVVVRGVVFDSLAMTPAANATVWLPGGTQTTTTDDKGRFQLDDVPRGPQFLAFSSGALDSLGLGTMGARVDVTGSVEPVQLATPSFQKVWRTLCSGVASASAADSGIVWGTVRDASSDVRLNGALTAFNWYDFKITAAKRYAYNEITHHAATDSTGNYYACGLPSDIRISAESAGERSASGVIEYVIGTRRLLRVDMLVSTDMVRAPSVAAEADSVTALRARGSSTLRGFMRDDKGRPVPNAVVTLAVVDTALRANDKGEFVISNLPAGTHELKARVIGYGPASMLVELRPNQTTTVTVALPAARVLATVNVRAERAAGQDKLAFDDRQRTRMGGFTLTPKDFGGRSGDVPSLLLGMPRVNVRRVNGGVQITFQRPAMGQCRPNVYIDGMRSDQDQLMSVQPEDIVALEVYNNRLIAPLGFDALDCGLLLFWTKRNPRW